MACWLVPCSPQIYDAEGAFNEYGDIIWHQQCNNMDIGDVVYIYVTAPIKEIRCKCVIEDVDIPIDMGTDDGYTIDEVFCNKAYSKYMKLQLIGTYDSDGLCYEMLRRNGLNSSIRSQRKASDELIEYINNFPVKR